MVLAMVKQASNAIVVRMGKTDTSSIQAQALAGRTTSAVRALYHRMHTYAIVGFTWSSWHAGANQGTSPVVHCLRRRVL